jgi:Asp-tRNA(Asn)/Glu-tRNA(Gln) amidotransferase A subunit family amidase
LAYFGPGKTKNPHNQGHTPGGSSSGSAAAVADFQVPLAIGTQTAGSVIRPASFCGTIGFKPTFGYISRTGILAQSPPLDTVGGYARSVKDIALFIDALSAYDPRDGDMTSTPKPTLSEALNNKLDRAPRFAFVKSPSWPQADERLQRAIEDFAGSFGARAEVVVTDLPAEFDGALRLQQIVQLSAIADKNPDAVTAKLKEAIAEGRSFSSADVAAARAERDPLYDALRPILINYDAILTPAAQGPAPEGLASTGSPMFNALWTYLGMPCISLPMLEVGGLPAGVQLVAARGEDAGLLRIAKWMYPGTGG